MRKIFTSVIAMIITICFTIAFDASIARGSDTMDDEGRKKNKRNSR